MKPKRSRPASDRPSYDAVRRRIYNSTRWQRLRLLKLADSPLCEVCAARGEVRPAEDVHHIVSFVSSSDTATIQHLAYDYGNLQSLCKQCHQRIHNEKDR